MYRLSLLVSTLLWIRVFGQFSPHGTNFKIDCENCHSQISWKVVVDDIKFNHTQTDFELIGRHKTVDCRKCHSNLEFQKTPQDCFSCHLDVHQTTVGKDCQRCHNSLSWLIENIIELHNNTRFPLVGEHNSIDCQQCHKSYSIRKFDVVDVECYSCHKSEYESASNPNHRVSGFPTTCSDCHSVYKQNWSGNFNHEFFPLIGGHSQKKCSDCHTNNIFSQIDKRCQSCHLSDYNRTQNPNHQRVGLSTTCIDCHEVIAWNVTKFNHNQTRFALTGGHILVSCENCHNGRTSGTSTVCFDCHQTNFNNTTNPNHRRLGISTECSSCHSTNPNWKPALFPQHDNYYILTGKHTLIRNNCFQCHQGNYSNTPRECVGCHLNNYNQSVNPNHSLLQFPTQCETCHSTNGWTPSTFNHDQMYFPIFSGKHRNTWSNCRTCHTTPSNYSVFSCLNCHEHRRERMDDKHRNVSGYIYESNACLSCHPNGTKPHSKDIHKTLDRE
jgi:hypothetical protein